jgi:phenylacetate-CoA ligase
VYDQYACGEVLGGAYECEERDGLHVAEEHNLIEVEAPSGEEGDILVTDLDNYAFPLIRYRNGDWGSLETGSCSCGRQLTRLRSSIGRKIEVVRFPDSREFNRTFFGRFFNQFAFIDAYQVVQTSATAVEVRVELNDTSAELAPIGRKLREHMGPEVKVTIDRNKISEGTSGKRQVIIPLSKPAQAVEDSLSD